MPPEGHADEDQLQAATSKHGSSRGVSVHILFLLSILLDLILDL